MSVSIYQCKALALVLSSGLAIWHQLPSRELLVHLMTQEMMSFQDTNIKNLVTLSMVTGVALVIMGGISYISSPNSGLYRPWKLNEGIAFVLVGLGAFLKIEAKKVLRVYSSLSSGGDPGCTIPYSYASLMHPANLGNLVCGMSYAWFTGITNLFIVLGLIGKWYSGFVSLLAEKETMLEQKFHPHSN